MSNNQHKTYLILDNIRSVHNVGSIFRTAECAGVSHIYCIGTTPVPLDRFGRKRKDFAKVSLGSEDLVAWEHVEGDGASIERLIIRLKKKRFHIVAVEQDKRSVKFGLTKPVKVDNGVAYIFGNEVEGVSPQLIKLADEGVEIPMRGKKESLNVSVAVGVMLFCYS